LQWIDPMEDTERKMFQWRVILLAALAVLLLLGGLLVLILPDLYEGPVIYRLDEQHAISAVDALAMVLLILGCALSWSAGALWQRRMYAS
jgi:drug/metabolite transporter (DMT)-like permease